MGSQKEKLADWVGSRKALVLQLGIILIYLTTRFYSVGSAMNEYFDYDEGTYLLIARLINHGYLPYRDIFAVHPPFYYYLLALWLRLFGDSYVVGRLLSVFLGLLAVMVAYLVGRELKDWKLGALFSLILTLDPTMIHMNSLVFHETLIELFTLLSLYHFVLYSKRDEMKHAYLSLFWAGLGTTSKFTIIPYSVALYLTLVLSLNGETLTYLKRASNVLFSRIQIFVLFATYLLMTALVAGVVVVCPSKLLRDLLIVPGVHPIEVIGHVISVGLFLIIWGILTLHVTKASYLRALLNTTRVLLNNWRVELKLLLALLVPKLIVEGILGLGVSRDYVSQTYLSQGRRYAPLVNFFSYINSILKHLYSSASQDFLVFYVPVVVVLALVVILWGEGRKLKSNSWLKALLLMNFIAYFLIFPVVPNQRFLYPFFIVFYLTALCTVLKSEIGLKRLAGMVVVALFLIGMASFGMAYRYPSGELKVAWASHTKELRDDLGGYISGNRLKNGTYLTMNPFNSYYLDLKVDPYYLDVFGITYLKNSSYLWKAVNGSQYLVFSTWMYAMEEESKVFEQAFGELEKRAHLNYSLLFSESFGRGDVISLFKRDNRSAVLSFDAYLGKLRLWVNGSPVGYIYLSEIVNRSGYFTRISQEKGKYIIVQGNDEHTASFGGNLTSVSLHLSLPEKRNLTIEFREPVVVMNPTSKSGAVDIYLPSFRGLKLHMVVDGEIVSIEKRKVIVECREMKLSILNSKV